MQSLQHPIASAEMDWLKETLHALLPMIAGGLFLSMIRWVTRQDRLAALAASNCVQKYPILEGLLSGELGQDTDLFGDTQPQAIANWARLATQDEKDKLVREIEEVTQGFHEEFNDRSSELFGMENTDPVFDMIRAITLDPDCYKRYE